MAERMTTSETATQSPPRRTGPAVQSEQAAATQGWREYIATMREHAKQLGLAGQHLPSSAEMADVMQHNGMVELALNALEAAEASREQEARLAAEDAAPAAEAESA